MRTHSFGSRSIDMKNISSSSLTCSKSPFPFDSEDKEDGIVILDLKGKVIYVNSAYERITGLKKQDILGLSSPELLARTHRDWVMNNLATAVITSRGEIPAPAISTCLTRTDGTEIPVHISTLVWKTPRGKPLYLIVTISEIKTSPHPEEPRLSTSSNVEEIIHQRTAELLRLNQILVREIAERKQVEASLRKSIELYRQFILTSPDAVIISDLTGKLMEVSPKTCEFLGYRHPSELEGKNILNFIPPNEWERARANMKKIIKQGIIRNVEHTFIKKDGTSLTGELNSALLKNPEEKPEAFLMIVRDTTERKRLERELLEISAREQQRIGQDLHDGLGQHLTAIAMMCKALENRLASQSRPEALEARKIMELVHQAISQANSLARGLCPVALDSRGLMTALADLARGTENIFGVSCRFICRHEVPVSEPTVANHIYRIAQEALTNAIRHSQATQITLKLASRNHHLILTVRDNGIGIPRSPKPYSGMGLLIMEYRARMINGTFSIKRHPRGGTIITCTIPTASSLARSGS